MRSCPTVTRTSLLEAAAEPLLHAAGERVATLGALLRGGIGLWGTAVTGACHARTGDRIDHAAEHEDEPDHAQYREATDLRGPKGHPTNQERKTHDEDDRALQPAAGRRCPKVPTAHTRRELGILGI